MKLIRMTQKQTQTTSQANKISTYLMLIVFVVMALSIAALFIAVDTYFLGDQLAAGALAAIGLIAMALSVFLLYQSRQTAAQVKIEIPKVMTTTGCVKDCDSKTSREFQRGDYVFKELDTNCEKCGGKQMIVAIYKEVKEKEKTYNV
jgi:hypothetical protein